MNNREWRLWQHRFYNSKRWRLVRQSVLSNKNYKCERCGLTVESKDFIVHHKIYITINNYTDVSVLYGENNLELVCLKCHNTEHKNKKSKNKIRQIIIGNDGKVSAIDPPRSKG